MHTHPCLPGHCKSVEVLCRRSKGAAERAGKLSGSDLDLHIGSGGEARQSLSKNAISLPATVARDALRAEVERAAAAKADMGSAGEADKPPLGAARYKSAGPVLTRG